MEDDYELKQVWRNGLLIVFMLDVISKQPAISGNTLYHFCSNLLKMHLSSDKIAITLHARSSYLPQSSP